MILPLLIAATAATGMPRITLHHRAGNHLVETTSYQSASKPAVDAEIATRAATACAGKQVDWGKFEFVEKIGKPPVASPPVVERDSRAFTCVVAHDRVIIPVPDGWAATAADEADVRRLFATYYARRDSGDARGAAAMFSEDARSDPTQFARQVADFNRQLGSGERRITFVSWEINPEAADRPGVYAALDFVGDYPKAIFYCGYIGFYRLGPGKYQMVREEQNVTLRSAANADSPEVAAMRAATCRE